MNNQYLSHFQLDQVRAVLRKYGIESADLRDELTDHYSGLIEERIEKGASFHEAFQEFVAQNSWLKLRKLQHAHWKYSEKSLLKFIWQSVKALYSFPRIVLPISVVVLVYYLLSLNSDLSRATLVAMHVTLIVQTLYIFVMAAINFRKHKMTDMASALQVSMSIFYVMIIPTWTSGLTIFDPFITSEAGIYVLLAYYLIIIHLAYLHQCVYQRAKAKMSQRQILV